MALYLTLLHWLPCLRPTPHHPPRAHTRLCYRHATLERVVQAYKTQRTRDRLRLFPGICLGLGECLFTKPTTPRSPCPSAYRLRLPSRPKQQHTLPCFACNQSQPAFAVKRGQQVSFLKLLISIAAPKFQKLRVGGDFRMLCIHYCSHIKGSEKLLSSYLYRLPISVYDDQ